MSAKKKIIWTRLAQKDREDILNYWIDHNQSNTYSIKLNKLFLSAIELLKRYPKLGKKTDINENIRVKLVRNYEIFYQIQKDTIYILTIWDSRKNPKNKGFSKLI